MSDVLLGFFVFIVAVSMTMVGKGGGNFYVVILAFAGFPMHQAATTGQFILFSASVSALMIFMKNRAILWPLAISIGIFVSFSALLGGYFSYLFSEFILKIIFSALLFISGFVMLIDVNRKKKYSLKKRVWSLKLKSGSEFYPIDIRIALPVTLVTGFASGMVGVSGGSFMVPLMVLACRVPMHLAVGTSSILIMISSLMGFTGHAIHGDFSPEIAVPLAIITIIGGLIGGKFALKSKPENLKKLFAFTNGIAAIFIMINTVCQ